MGNPYAHTHPELDHLPVAELTGQVRDPKTLMEDRLGVAVTSFAYPYGHYDRRVREAVAAAGYGGMHDGQLGGYGGRASARTAPHRHVR